jgi:hypothetical protein
LVAGKAYMSDMYRQWTNLKGEEKKKRDKTMARGVGVRPWWLVGASMVPFLPPTPRDTAVLPSPSRHRRHCLFYVHCPCSLGRLLAHTGTCTCVSEIEISSPDFW